MFAHVVNRVNKNQVVVAGTSAGSMVMCNPLYGGGISYGHLYFSTRVGLAPKNISDGGINGSSIEDVRNGTKGIQY